MNKVKTKNRLIILGALMLMLALVACSESNDNKVGSNVVNNREENVAQANDETVTEDSNEENVPDEEENPKEQESLKDPTILILVNKEYGLTEDYVPEDLITVEVPTVLENPEVNQLRVVAADALKLMFEEAKQSDVYLHARSGYRSYQTQAQLFKNYSERHGEEAANRYSAKPGHSEHQTGLVMDVTSESVDYQLEEIFGETKEGEWLKDHAHEYGFIIRYPQGAEDITGYIYEPWHIRYLGIEMATHVYESELTYEEYLEQEGMTNDVTPQ